MRKPFRFKEFAIKQADAAMPVTTDACIFGAIICPKSTGNVLDIGTGTGLLALMLAQRFAEIEITAIEVQEESTAIAAENVLASPFAHRIHVKHQDVLEFEPSIAFDSIICNPPFFENQLPSEKNSERLARHTGELNYETLMAKMADLLSANGESFLLVPIIHLGKCLFIAHKHRLHVMRILKIKSMPTKAAHVAVVVFSKQFAMTMETEFIVYQFAGEYTSEMIELMEPFYLNL